MKQHFSPRTARALAPFFAATALVATPALAQETPQAAPPQAAAPAPEPAIVTPPRAATVPIPTVVPTVPDGAPAAAAADATPAPRAAPRSTATRTVTRTETARPAAAPAAPAATAPASQPATPSAPVAAAPEPAPVAAPADRPNAATADADTTLRTTTTTLPLWTWAAAGIAGLIVLLGVLFALRRRRNDDEYVETEYVEEPYVEEAYVEPVAVAPVIATPLPVAKVQPRKEPELLRRTDPVGAIEPAIAAPDEVHMSEPAADDVAELTAGTAPVAERPWLEFAMRPVRAGTNVDEALVEIELTVGNSGSVSAKDVRISTFLLSGDARGEEMERLLINPPADASTDPVTIDPGEGKRVDATLALLKSDMGENLPASFRPVVVADARYTMADGSEGRTSASFVVGVTPEDGDGFTLEPIELSRSSMHDNVGAELQGEPQHA